jgi:hypothetical protein
VSPTNGAVFRHSRAITKASVSRSHIRETIRLPKK